MNIINNTIVSNDTTASSGVLFNTLGAPLASAPGERAPELSTARPRRRSPRPGEHAEQRDADGEPCTMPVACTCPDHGQPRTARKFSYPLLANDVFWQNRSFYIGVGALSTGSTSRTSSRCITRSPGRRAESAADGRDHADGNGAVITGGTGACVAASYWDIGVRGDTGPSNHSSSGARSPDVLGPDQTRSENAAGLRTTTRHQPDRRQPVLQRFADAAGIRVGRG